MRFERMTYCLEGSCSIQLSYQGKLIYKFVFKTKCLLSSKYKPRNNYLGKIKFNRNKERMQAKYYKNQKEYYV